MTSSQLDQHDLDQSGGGLSAEELEEEGIVDLPNREAMSVTIPFGGHVFGQVASKVSEALEHAVNDAPVEGGD